MIKQEEPHTQSTKTLIIKSNSKESVQKLETKQQSALAKDPKASADKPAKKYCLEDFDTVKALGRGSFGQVKLIRHKTTHELFALKIL